jgi:DNA replication protein DnaC
MLLGPIGTGKSSAAALIVREAIEVGRFCWWSYVPDLVDELTQNVASRRQEMVRQTQASLVVWDDFGAREFADWEIGHLDQIVERRYRARKPMIVTTNLTTQDLRADQRLARIVDRWRQRTCSSMIVLNGESMRTPGGVA